MFGSERTDGEGQNDSSRFCVFFGFHLLLASSSIPLPRADFDANGQTAVGIRFPPPKNRITGNVVGNVSFVLVFSSSALY